MKEKRLQRIEHAVDGLNKKRSPENEVSAKIEHLIKNNDEYKEVLKDLYYLEKAYENQEIDEHTLIEKWNRKVEKMKHIENTFEDM